MTNKSRVVLLILDGWGYRKEMEHNGVLLSSPTNYNRLMIQNEHTLLDASGEEVGLPAGQMGNSEVGHTNIGAGRVVMQELLKISKDIQSGGIKQNNNLNTFFKKIANTSSRVHLLGLLSDGGVHSHIDHFKGIIESAKESGIKELYLHCFTDGRDTPPNSGLGFIKDIQSFLDNNSYGKIATIIGRYYVMDRDKHWDRVEKAWNALRNGVGNTATDPITAMQNSKESDEFVLPTIIDNVDGKLKDGDGILMMNFRADRVREIVQVMSDKNFKEFNQGSIPNLEIITLTTYDKGFNFPTIYKNEDLTDILGEIVSQNGLTQLRIAETEKYAHVTYFFNGGREVAFDGEKRELIASPRDVPTYDLKPEMSVDQIVERFEHAFKTGDIDLVVMNFANPDMVGHTGIEESIIKACKTVDNALGKVIKIVDDMNAVLLITADHGNSEYTWDYDTNQPHTAHTTNKVPFILYNYDAKLVDSGGKLSDIAPTILEIFKLEKPKTMTGKSLLR